MLNFRNTRFIKSVENLNDRPELAMPEILFVGKSNVGKSSLINALCENKSLAYTSSSPGHTRLLNYYEVDRAFYLVDAPGYGYSKAGKTHLERFSIMMESYFADKQSIKGIIFLLDSRREPSQDDLDFYKFLKEAELPFFVAMTKTDKLNQKEKHIMLENLKKYLPSLPSSQTICLSSFITSTLLPLKKAISHLLGE